jgi:hypothetical protein
VEVSDLAVATPADRVWVIAWIPAEGAERRRDETRDGAKHPRIVRDRGAREARESRRTVDGLDSPSVAFSSIWVKNATLDETVRIRYA